ncbi:NAD(P)H-flavin reductase [Chromohalobacter japonicus]|uniref:NAD(P)H-flavin reductase n=1 Tax=Chromohalobacter japonicus TaxID=223900 RepID=A0A1Q8TGQ6_9GAMM|nr:NAD(P)H-flavin reductase [Chromohalobacter japonicus]OLO12826.1 NAD(P)H-flavin reductase [Chromohalobacter japonicus]
MTPKTLTCHVESVEDLTADVFRVHLAGRREAIAHAPGQYLELKLDEDIWVPFSIANAHVDDGIIELHVQHWPERSNSARLREMLVQAAQLTVRLPNGGCVLDTQSRRPLTLIAAGTGFAQMKAIVEAALANEHPGPIRLWWAVKHPRDLYLESLALQWVAEHTHVEMHTVSEESDSGLSTPPGVTRHVGRIDAVLAEVLGDVSGEDVYLSGSPGMVYACIDTLAPLGLDPERVFSDVFAYAPRVPLIPLPDDLAESAPLVPGERRTEDDT